MSEPRLRVDWTIPVWGVVGLAVQAAAIVWWGATVQAQVDGLEGRVAKIEGSAELVARLDERTAAMSEALKRIEENQRGNR